MKIGYNHSGYNQLRNFAGLEFDNFEFVKVFDPCKIIDYISYKGFKKNNVIAHNLYLETGFYQNVTLYHFFNTIAITHKPWIVTFEELLPRYNSNSQLGLKLLSKNNCKKIIAFCQNTYDIQKLHLNNFPEYKEDILSKMIVIQPSQTVKTSNFIKDVSNKINFTFIGNEFFRKGGAEILSVFDEIIPKFSEVNLTIITRFGYGKWKDEHITNQDVVKAKKVVAKYPKNINLLLGVTNEEVLSILKNSHVALLPSYGESYGYSVLEAQSCACPVITTRMPPFEEFNNMDNGWLIDVPLVKKNGSLTSDVYTEKGLKYFSNTLRNNLYDTVISILNNKELIENKARKSLQNIIENHDPIKTITLLESIYNETIS